MVQPSNKSGMQPKCTWTTFGLGALVLMAGFSVYLALFRIYQVDECQNLYMARVLVEGQSASFFTNASLFLFGPLSWITHAPLHSAQMFDWARLIFLGVFWLNLTLMAAIASRNLFSTRGLACLLAATTLAPLWDYGFEIRHDNLVLTGILLSWWLLRVKPLGLRSYLIIGGVSVVLLFVAVKSIVYVLPLSVATLLFPPASHRRARWQLALAWLAGACLAVAVLRGLYGTGEAWDNYLSVFRGVSGYSASTESKRTWPWNTLARLLSQTPLLLAVMFAALTVVVMNVIQRRRAAFTWNGYFPEFLLLWGAMAALLANPTPFPYNLVNFVPYAFLLACKYGDELWARIRGQAKLWPIITTILIFIQLAPFLLATKRHLEYPNSRQKILMKLSEAMSDPVKDMVYDAIGMVPTRRSIHYQWYLHSLNIRHMISTPGMRVREMLAARPAAVFIPNYRTDWLPAEDHDFIRKHYIPLADDFWVLGAWLPAGGGSFEIFHPGRYQIVQVKEAATAKTLHSTHIDQPLEADGTVSGWLDKERLTAQPTQLTSGFHQIECDKKGARIAVVWVGPQLAEIPQPASGSHLFLFRNWY